MEYWDLQILKDTILAAKDAKDLQDALAELVEMMIKAQPEHEYYEG